MRQFTDKKNRQWVIEINATQIKRVKGLTGVDLFRMGDDGLSALSALLADAILLVDVIYALCKQQCDDASPKISDEAFGEGMAGDAIGQAAKAFVEELVDFFQSPEQRDVLTRALAKAKEAEHLLRQEQARRLDSLDMAAEVKKLIAAAPSGSPTTTPASAEWTPAL